MAQNITLLGASYSDVPAVTLPKTGGGTASFTDVTDTTATASDVASGKYFYLADGTKTEGTASGGGGSIDFSSIKQTFSLTNIGSLFTAFENGKWASLEYSCVSGTNPITVNFGRAIKGLLIYPKSLATDDIGGEAPAMSFSFWNDPDENGAQSRKWGVLKMKTSGNANTNLLSRISSYTLQNGVLSMVPQYPTNAAYHPFRFNIPYILLYWWE